MARKKKQTTGTGAENVNPAEQGAEPAGKDPAAAADGQDHAQQETEESATDGQETTIDPDSSSTEKELEGEAGTDPDADSTEEATIDPDTDAEEGREEETTIDPDGITDEDREELAASLDNMASAAFKTGEAIDGILNSGAAELIRNQQRFLKYAQPPIPAVEALQQTLWMLKNSIPPLKQAITESHKALYTYFRTPEWSKMQASFREFLENAPRIISFSDEIEQLRPYFDEELKKPEYGGITLDELLNEDTPDADDLFLKALSAARAARDARQATIDAQNEGRERRRQAKEAAQKSGAIMDLRNGTLPVFSERGLWDAFSPSKISRMGKLPDDVIDKRTGRVNEEEIQSGDITPVSAAELSYKALLLLSAIKANSVENFRETFVQDGAITFYVKGVLDRLDVDPRIRDDMQITLDRKTAGALYLEKQFEPLLNLVGTTPNGSRYAVLNYHGYDVKNDTMTIRTPYIFQLWMATQSAYSERKKNRELRITEGKKPLKADLKPLELNELFKAVACKEEDAVLEIAVYITNVLLNAGHGAHKTEISYRKLIKNCSRLKERLEKIDRAPDRTEDGKKINKAARYNSELRKIARAYNLIMDSEKSAALTYFAFDEFSPSKVKGNRREFIPPTKSTLDGKITIKWHRINTDDAE